MKNILQNLNWHHFAEVDSTQTKANEILAKQEWNNAILITADTQTKGYGTKGQKWESPKGNISATLCLEKNQFWKFVRKHNIEGKEQNPIIIFAKIVQKAAYELTKKELQLKLPNDLLYKNKKCAGFIITEATDIKNQEIYCIGMGINCKQAPTTTQPSTSIGCDKLKLLEKILSHISSIKL